MISQRRRVEGLRDLLSAQITHRFAGEVKSSCGYSFRTTLSCTEHGQRRPRGRWASHKVREKEKKKKTREILKVLDSHNSNNVGLNPSRRCPGRGLRLLGEGEQWEAANQLRLTFSSQAVEEKDRRGTTAAAALAHV